MIHLPVGMNRAHMIMIKRPSGIVLEQWLCGSGQGHIVNNTGTGTKVSTGPGGLQSGGWGDKLKDTLGQRFFCSLNLPLQ